jgi:2-polyprenyl-6-methoxyphenol hydroxylase-like FAD-dependent oxidoreductase
MATTTVRCTRACRAVSTVRCSKLGSGRAVLVGDAAHAFSPNLGCGAASGMQDGALLGACVAKHLEASGSWEGVADAWTHQRLADAHAYACISDALTDFLYFLRHKSYWRLLKSLPAGSVLMLTFFIATCPLPSAHLLHGLLQCCFLDSYHVAQLCICMGASLLSASQVFVMC